jgi:hypothetical protein
MEQYFLSTPDQSTSRTDTQKDYVPQYNWRGDTFVLK